MTEAESLKTMLLFYFFLLSEPAFYSFSLNLTTLSPLPSLIFFVSGFAACWVDLCRRFAKAPRPTDRIDFLLTNLLLFLSCSLVVLPIIGCFFCRRVGLVSLQFFNFTNYSIFALLKNWQQTLLISQYSLAICSYLYPKLTIHFFIDSFSLSPNLSTATASRTSSQQSGCFCCF